MKKVIHCPCGHILRADTDEEVIRLAQHHAKSEHNMELSTEEALSMARPE